MKKNIYFKIIPMGIIKDIFTDSKNIWEMLLVKDTYLGKMESRSSGKIDKSVILKNNVNIGSNTIIEPFCVIEGPVYIGKNCYIRPHCFIRPGTVIGDNVTIGHGVEVKNSIIMDECKLDSHSFVGDSIFGVGVRNGSGTITANRRFDQEDIKVKYKDNEFDTGFDKFGCIIGDYTRLGANCTVAPGTVIGRHVWIYPNIFIRGFIPGNTFVKLNQDLKLSSKENMILKRYDKLNNR